MACRPSPLTQPLAHPYYWELRCRLVCMKCRSELEKGRDENARPIAGAACPGQFRDSDSRSIFLVTGLCQRCQDKFWDQYQDWRVLWEDTTGLEIVEEEVEEVQEE